LNQAVQSGSSLWSLTTYFRRRYIGRLVITTNAHVISVTVAA
jgi:hypothetical protein